MRHLPSSALSAGLIVGGVLAWASVARPLTGNPELATAPNPLGIARSPYGEVLAMAMQGPIDVFFHGAAEDPHKDCGDDCDGHDHEDHDDPDAPAAAAPAPGGFANFISGLDRAMTARTNPKPASPTLKRYLLCQTANKLRFAYNLDPAHYGNFASYYFFLTQPELGGRRDLTPSAVALARETIDYCLQREDDPRPALTAAAATENILEQLIADHKSGGNRELTLAQLRQNLALLDQCLARYAEISAQWDATGNWELISSFRRDEVRDRLHLLGKIRNADATIIERLAQPAAQASR